MYILWHFSKGHSVGQLQGVFDDENLVKSVCQEGDCYMHIELNKVYIDDTDTEDVALFKCPSGEFKDKFGYLKELDELKHETNTVH